MINKGKTKSYFCIILFSILKIQLGLCSDSLNVFLLHSGQESMIFQTYSPLHTKFNGPLSLSKKPTSEVLNLVILNLDIHPWKNAHFGISPEYLSGNGVGNGTSIASYPNGIYGFPQYRPYLQKLFLKQVFLIKRFENSEYSITTGRLIPQDNIDLNRYSNNPNHDFLNFSHNMMSAWDVAATAFGWSYGACFNLKLDRTKFTFLLLNTNKEAGSQNPDLNFKKALSYNFQFAKTFSFLKKESNFRILGFANQTYSFSYNQVNKSNSMVLDSFRTYKYKYGLAFDTDIQINEYFGFFGRYSINDGKTESFGYTEIDRSINIGGVIHAFFLNRKIDIIGVAISKNSISKSHRTFLEKGYNGFMLGDGNLKYGDENVLEIFYAFSLSKILIFTPNYQYVSNIGFNKSRGSAHFYAFRIHYNF